VADIDTALGPQIFDLPERQPIAVAHHHRDVRTDAAAGPYIRMSRNKAPKSGFFNRPTVAQII
jgi:hypothetical protein